MLTAPASTEKLLIKRVVPATQPSDFVNNDASDAEVVEDALDRLTMIAQQKNADSDYPIRLSDAETPTDALTVLPFDRASKVLAFNSSKELIATESEEAAALSAALAESGGSSLIGFVQSGTGARSRTLQTKVREIVSVTDFENSAGVEVVGDNSTDNSVGFSRAAALADVLIAVPGRTEDGDSAVYLVDTYTALGNGQRWLGLGNPTVKMKADATTPRCIFYMEDNTDIAIEGMTLDGNGANQTNFNSTQKGLVEMQSGCARIALRDLHVKDALQWGVHLKGNTTLGIPDTITMDNVTTRGSLGTGTGGTGGSEGKTGVAWVAGTNVRINGGQSFDLFDIENATASQFCQGVISGRLFRNGADIADDVSCDTCVFLLPSDTDRDWAVRLTFGAPQFTDCQILENDPATGTAVRTENWIGLAVDANNIDRWSWRGGKIKGTTLCCIALRSFARAVIDGVTLDASTTDETTTVTFDSQTFHFGGIVMPAGSIRHGAVLNVRGLAVSGFTGKFIDLATTDQRALDVINNSVLNTDTDSLGNIFVYGARAQRQNIKNNNAIVSTNYTTTDVTDDIEVDFRNGTGCVVTYYKSNLTAPSDGTHVVGDLAYTRAPAAAGSIGQVCTTAGTPGTWKTFGAIAS
jgi:hypothetical protein